MALSVFLLVLSVLHCTNCYHCDKAEQQWSELQEALHFIGKNATVARDIVMAVLERSNADNLYNNLVKTRCIHNRRLPRFDTLEEFIAKDEFIERFVYRGARVPISKNNYDQVTTLALSVLIQLDRYVCGMVREHEDVYPVLLKYRREFNITHLLDMVTTLYNPRHLLGLNDRLIAHYNRLQCLNTDMIESDINHFLKPQHNHIRRSAAKHGELKLRSSDNPEEQKLFLIGGNYYFGNVYINPQFYHITDGMIQKSDNKHQSSPLPLLSTATSITHKSNHHENRPLSPRTTATVIPHRSDYHESKPFPIWSTATVFPHRSEHNFHETWMTDHKPRPQEELHRIHIQSVNLVSPIIVSAMIKGIKIYTNDRACPIEHVDYIMRHYGHNRFFINDTGVETLITDIIKNQNVKTKDLIDYSSQQDIHESHCRTKSTFNNRTFVDTEAVATYVNFTKLLTSKDIVSMETPNGEHFLSTAQFLDACPLIIYSLLQRMNNKSLSQNLDDKMLPPSALEKYGLGSASVFVISICSLIGAIFVKLANKNVREYAMGMLLSLSIGCLIGDAVLHLIPDILVKEEETNKPRIPETLTKQSALLASIYGFFLLELTLSRLKTKKGHTCSIITDDNIENESRETNNSSLAWMVVIGDSIHNFADGLAIGAAFSKDITVGLSTSIAVFCHELPHELGDFAALVSTGMSIKKAMLLNFASSLTAFAGLYIGIVASSNDVARTWIFSAGAGMFIYVALSNLVPEVLSYFRKYPNLPMFLSLNIGLLLGYVSMLLLAIYEHDIKLS